MIFEFYESIEAIYILDTYLGTYNVKKLFLVYLLLALSTSLFVKDAYIVRQYCSYLKTKQKTKSLHIVIVLTKSKSKLLYQVNPPTYLDIPNNLPITKYDKNFKRKTIAPRPSRIIQSDRRRRPPAPIVVREGWNMRAGRPYCSFVFERTRSTRRNDAMFVSSWRDNLILLKF